MNSMIDLARQRAGTVIQFNTGGSSYWIAVNFGTGPIKGRQDRVRGCLVTSSKKDFVAAGIASLNDIVVQRFIEVGKTVDIVISGNKITTGDVVSVRTI